MNEGVIYFGPRQTRDLKLQESTEPKMPGAGTCGSNTFLSQLENITSECVRKFVTFC